jgi:hypothetical protein
MIKRIFKGKCLMTRFDILKESIDTIYNKDLAKKNSNSAFIEASCKNKENPMAGVAAFMMHNGTCMTGPGGLYGIANNWDYAPGTETYPGKELCLKIAEKIAKSRIKVWGLSPNSSRTNFYSHIRIKGDCLCLTPDLINHFVSDIKYIIKTHPNYYFCGMYMESRIRKENACFPELEQTIEPYIKTMFHFQIDVENYINKIYGNVKSWEQQ